MFERALSMLPDCLLLHLALAEKYEQREDTEAAKKVCGATLREQKMCMFVCVRVSNTRQDVYVCVSQYRANCRASI